QYCTDYEVEPLRFVSSCNRNLLRQEIKVRYNILQLPKLFFANQWRKITTRYDVINTLVPNHGKE
ncbi:MAG: hypothetical protein ACJ72C_10765, partial [Nitrososphaeraceae archaeon]